MDRRVILISTQKSFMINAMIKNLEGESFEVIQMEPDADAYSSIDAAPIVLVYLDNDAGTAVSFLRSLAAKGIDALRDSRIFLAGNEQELEEVESAISGSLEYSILKRPLNVRELIEKWNAISDTSEKREGKKRILVVDDDGTMLRTLKLWLSDKYQVYMANSGANAISLLAKKDVDLVLLDYEMPVASGPQVLKQLRSNEATCDIPVMFLTAKNDKESMESVKDLNPVRYLLKTMPPDVLQKHIDSFFTRRGEDDE